MKDGKRRLELLKKAFGLLTLPICVVLTLYILMELADLSSQSQPHRNFYARTVFMLIAYFLLFKIA
jgi:hypothetical protein